MAERTGLEPVRKPPLATAGRQVVDLIGPGRPRLVRAGQHRAQNGGANPDRRRPAGAPIRTAVVFIIAVVSGLLGIVWVALP